MCSNKFKQKQIERKRAADEKLSLHATTSTVLDAQYHEMHRDVRENCLVGTQAEVGLYLLYG